MSAIYDNWERLVAATLRREELWQLCHDHSRSPSVLSEASDLSSSFSLESPVHDLAIDFSTLGSSSRLLPHEFPKLVLISDFSPAFGVNELGLASTELLGRGTFGISYSAAMDNGKTIVVKRLESKTISEPDFKSHMDIIGNVRHENVVAFRAYYSSEDERVMLYDYYNKGSVYALLHGRAGGNQDHVDWETRLKIAIGAARGIAEIHKQNGGKLVHGNIKLSNIFLNPQHYGCVSDLGLANMIETKFMPNSRCYAPEVKNTRNVSQASDVYSLGIMLLELLTRKSTTHSPGGPEAVDLVKLVGSVKSKDRAAKVFDADLLKNPTIKEDMVTMLQIGMNCVAKSIKKRPKMSEVVKMLDDLSRINHENHVPTRNKLVFIEDANPAFDLEDILRASAEVLGKGTFGTSYKAMLENGQTIVVKRLKDVIVTPKDFHQHMEIIGRMGHENVVELRAYFYSRDEKLLIYDYHTQDSVSAMLHGTDKRPLDWETRLKIAVGAARGIAHIHRQDGGKLVHVNIKSSNIFVNEQNYGIVSDVGLANLIYPVTRSSMRTPGYCAPEVTDTTKVSQASDIYSFGVLLFELLTGKPSQFTTDDGQVISIVNWIQAVVRDEWTAEVFDLELMRYQNTEEAMVQLLQIAIDCAAIVPERRPRMPEVVKTLEEISGIPPSNESSFGDTRREPSIESSLENLLENLLPTLNP